MEERVLKQKAKLDASFMLLPTYYLPTYLPITYLPITYLRYTCNSTYEQRSPGGLVAYLEEGSIPTSVAHVIKQFRP